MGCKKENQGLTGQKKRLTVRNGFSPYILLRLARFFFYCQNVVQIFPAIFGVVDQQSGIVHFRFCTFGNRYVKTAVTVSFILIAAVTNQRCVGMFK